MRTRLRRTAAVLGVLVASAGILVGTAAAANATQQHTKTVTWVTQLAPGVTTPTGADDVTWPQKLGTYAPECDAVLQIDTYRYDTQGDKATVDALIAHGTLNKPGSAHWTDTSVVLSWKFVILPPCNSPSPTPTPSDTPTPTPTPSDTPTPTPSDTPTPTPTPTCGIVTADQPACPTPTPPVDGCAQGNLAACPTLPASPPVSVSPSATTKPTPAPVATVKCAQGQVLNNGKCELPHTGTNVMALALPATAAIICGIGLIFAAPFLFANNRRARRRLK